MEILRDELHELRQFTCQDVSLWHGIDYKEIDAVQKVLLCKFDLVLHPFVHEAGVVHIFQRECLCKRAMASVSDSDSWLTYTNLV